MWEIKKADIIRLLKIVTDVKKNQRHSRPPALRR